MCPPPSKIGARPGCREGTAHFRRLTPPPFAAQNPLQAAAIFIDADVPQGLGGSDVRRCAAPLPGCAPENRLLPATDAALPNGFPLGLGRGLHPNCAFRALLHGFPLALKFPSRSREGYRSRTSGCHRQFARAASQPRRPRSLQRISPRLKIPLALARGLPQPHQRLPPTVREGCIPTAPPAPSPTDFPSP